MLQRWSKLEKVYSTWGASGTKLTGVMFFHMHRISRGLMTNLILAKYLIFMTVSSSTYCTTGTYTYIHTSILIHTADDAVRATCKPLILSCRLMGLDQNNLHVLFDKAMYLADIVIPQVLYIAL